MIKNIEDLDKIKEIGLDRLYPKKIKIVVGMATCGVATGAKSVYKELESFIQAGNLDIELRRTGCLGFCQMEPIVDVYVPGMPRLTYKQVTPVKAKEIISALGETRVKKEYLLCKAENDVLIDETFKEFDIKKATSELENIGLCEQVPFFAKQKKIVLRNCGVIDPDSIEEYIARGGYYSLAKVLLKASSDDVIAEVIKSGLRGRGGAGFPTGKKWQLCAKSKCDTKYIVCNADEGDPGAYMDRSVLEGDPHSVLEGMMIAAFAIGAEEGFIYVRTEYPLVIKRLKSAILKAVEYGLLGENIFGSGFNFDIQIREGSGAFVCGEETSLIHSIQGVAPEPRQRPPFPVESGLWGCPTNINNVETFANIAVIMDKGGEWFGKIGTEKSKGTKVFSIVGKIKNTGLVEVPMGITLREIIYDIAGGILDGKKFKAVQTGGPSGGCIPDSLIDLPVDYESLREVGSIMGSGGMVVMDEDTCMVDVAKFFLNFTSDESCGKCTSCRDGSQALLEVLDRISDGQGNEDDLAFLEELAEAIKDASLCGLGKTLPNPILSTLKYFKEEFEAHIKDKRCPAGVCKKLTSFYIDQNKCQACGACIRNCPTQAISGRKGHVHVIEQAKCTKCGACFDVCPKKFSAVEKISGKPVPGAKKGLKIKNKE